MRVKIQLTIPDPPLILPTHYNRTLQGFIYHHMDATLATYLHEHGWRDGKRRFPLFVFSRLFGDFKRRDGKLHFLGPISFHLASPATDTLASFVEHLFQRREVRLGATPLWLESIEVMPEQPLPRPLPLKALSPITIYSTFKTADDRKKTYYYAPKEPEFGRLVLENLRRKIRAWTGGDIPPDGATFRPLRVSNRNLVVARYKETIIKGWTGIYELDAPEPYLRMALDAGLGAKNSQGFGCVEVWKKCRRAHRARDEAR